MNNSKKKITYLFGEGRIKRLQSTTNTSDEFFYGYHHVKEIYPETKIIEMDPTLKKPILNFFDRILRKITHLPFYLSHIVTYKNFVQINKSDVIMATNDRIAISALPIILLSKVFTKTKILVVVMGLLSNANKKNDNLLDKLILNLFLKITDEFLFLGKPECSKAVSLYPKYSDKFLFLPFCINEKFWEADESKSALKDKIAFIGNDGNRDYDKVIEIAKSFPQIDFIFVTQLSSKNKIPDNVQLLSGSWGDNTLSDLEIKKIYSQSRITILPLKETIQPSGQSVALQSICSGTPVMITKTEGFWDSSKYKNKENIFFINDNSIDSWIENIDKVYFNVSLLEKISKNGIELIKEEYYLDKFNKRLLRML